MIFYVFNHGLLLQAHYAAAKLNQFLSKKKILCACALLKQKNLHANACTYTVYKNFKISKRVFFFPVLHHCEHLTYSWRQTRLCTIKGLFLIPLPVLLCLFYFRFGLVYLMIERWKNLKLSRKSTKKLRSGYAGEWDDAGLNASQKICA